MNGLVDTFSNRLKTAIRIRNIKPVELSEKTGIDKSKISSYMSGRYKAKQDGIYLLAKALDVNEAWLMGCNVPMERVFAKSKEKYIKIDKFGNSVVSIPLLGEVRAGYDYLAQENWLGTVDIKEELAKTGDFFALKIKGNSMFETLWDGDIVAVKKQDFANDGNIAVVLINGDEATIKKVKILDNGIKLIPLNRRINPETQEPYYEDKTYTKEDIETKPVQIIGIVKQIIERNF